MNSSPQKIDEATKSRVFRALITCLERANEYMRNTGCPRRVSLDDIAGELMTSKKTTREILRILAREGSISLFGIEGVAESHGYIHSERHKQTVLLG